MDSPEHILADDSLRDRFGRQVAGDEPGGMLRSLKLKLISTCNLRCTMCRYWRIPRRSLALDVVRSVLDDAALLGCGKVHLSGGEVTLYPDLVAVIAHATSLGLRVNLTTNGVLLDRARARAWLDAGLHAVSVSLDGARSATHDAIRGVAGAFEQTIKGVRNLMREKMRRRSPVRLRINSVIQRRNLAELPDLVHLAVELGACDLVPMPIDGASADRPSAEELNAYNQTIAPEVLRLRRQFGLPTSDERIYPWGRTGEELALSARGLYALGHYDGHLCYAPWLHAFVGHLGDVYACCMTSERMPSLGNVNRDRLAAIFSGPAYERFRAEMRQQRLLMCGHCDQFLPENRLLGQSLGPAPAAPAVAARFPLPLVKAI